MRIAAMLLLLASCCLAIFAWWGIYTRAGNRAFDEMAGVVPMYAGFAAAVGLLLSLALGLISLDRRE